MTKSSARWVTRLLAVENKCNRVTDSMDDLALFRRGPSEFLRRYITLGTGREVNSVKKRHVLKNFFGDTDSVRSFSQFSYNNATFEHYLPKFSLQNI